MTRNGRLHWMLYNVLSIIQRDATSLYQVMKNGEIDPAESLYQLFQVSVNNSEAVWQSSKNSWGGVNGRVVSVDVHRVQFLADSVVSESSRKPSMTF